MIQERVAEYLDEKGITNVALSKATGMTEMALSTARRGQRRLTADEYCSICDFLEVSMDKFNQPDQPKES